MTGKRPRIPKRPVESVAAPSVADGPGEAMRAWGLILRNIGLLSGALIIVGSGVFVGMGLRAGPEGFVVYGGAGIGVGLLVVLQAFWLKALHDAAAEVIRLLGR